MMDDRTQPMPVDVDVRALIEEHGVPAEGTVITWEELERVVGLPRDRNRFRSVIESWRAQLENDHAVWMKTIRNVGVISATPVQRLEQSSSWVNRAKRTVGRAASLAVRTDRTRLNAHERRIVDHQCELQGRMIAWQRTAPAELPMDGMPGED